MPRRILQGIVTSNKADKTVTVNVERRLAHPVYGKIIRRTKKYHAHDESNSCQIGDTVRIIECAPISKTKSWMVVTGDEAQATKAAPKASAPKKTAAKK